MPVAGVPSPSRLGVAAPAWADGRVTAGSPLTDRSAIRTLVERTSRFVMLVHLPDGHNAEQVSTALLQRGGSDSRASSASLTWDQGSEWAVTATSAVFFCDPASPWQRGSNENTNGLLGQYFPKGTDLSSHAAQELAAVAAELNGRPRETLGWQTPAAHLERLLGRTP